MTGQTDNGNSLIYMYETYILCYIFKPVLYFLIFLLVMKHFRNPEIIHVNGKAQLGRSHRKKIGKVSTLRGISPEFRKDCKDILLTKIYYQAPYVFKGDPNDPHTILRDAVRGMKCVMKGFLLSALCFGHSPYHESKIINNQCQNVSVMHHLYHNILGIPYGATVYEFTQVLTVIVTGDGGRMPKVPRNTPMLALAFLRVLGFICVTFTYLLYIWHAM